MYCEECGKPTTIIEEDQNIQSSCCYAALFYDSSLHDEYTWGEYKMEEAEYWEECKADEQHMRELEELRFPY